MFHLFLASHTTVYERSAAPQQLYKLRSYQIELAEKAVDGNNTIICSETGTGKTFVAMHIIEKHLAASPKGNHV